MVNTFLNVTQPTKCHSIYIFVFCVSICQLYFITLNITMDVINYHISHHHYNSQTRNSAFIQLIMLRTENYNTNDICNVNTINMVLGCCFTWQKCHPMAWMVSHLPLTIEAKVQSPAGLCGIYVVKVQLRQVFLKLFVFPLVSFHQCSILIYLPIPDTIWT
jgi:hypothetical protein